MVSGRLLALLLARIKVFGLPSSRPLGQIIDLSDKSSMKSPYQMRLMKFAYLLVGSFWLVACAAVAPATPVPDLDSSLEYFSDLAYDHVAGEVEYAQTPPVGGAHNPLWQNCGVYDEPVPSEQAVHSLEHGAIWLTYQPDLAEEEVALLRELVTGKSHALLSPFPDLPAPVVASAWGVQLKVESASDPRLAQFVEKFHNGPQTPEPGAPCRGGVGTPLASHLPVAG